MNQKDKTDTGNEIPHEDANARTPNQDYPPSHQGEGEQIEEYPKAERHKRFRLPKLGNWKFDAINFFMLIAFIITSVIQNIYTNKSISIAEKTLQITDSVSRMGLRSYVMINRVEFPSSDSTDLVYVIHGTNTGNTPAFNLAGYAEWGQKISGISRFMTRTDFGDVDVSPIMQGNGIDFDISFTTVGTPKYVLISMIKSGIVPYFYGVITYDDIFKSQHRTRFCFYIDPTFTVKRYKKYNDGD